MAKIVTQFVVILLAIMTSAALASEAPQVGENLTVTIETETPQVISGEVVFTSAPGSPNLLGVKSSDNLLHVIDLDHVPTDLPIEVKITAPEGTEIRRDRVSKLRSFLIHTFTLLNVSGTVFYSLYWDSIYGHFNPANRPDWPWVDHASSYLLSAFFLSTAASTLELSGIPVKQKGPILVTMALMFTSLHAMLEIPIFGAANQGMGANVPDMMDFIVGTGAAWSVAILPIAPEAVRAGAKVLKKCTQAILGGGKTRPRESSRTPFAL